MIKNRNIGLDIFKIISALIVCAFHTRIHLNANYGILNNFIQMGAIFMTAFFMLSGFLLFLNYKDYKFNEKKELYLYLKKRIISIIPLYFIISILYYIYYYDKTMILQNIILIPIELLGLQSFFSSLFSYAHNGGTWFISCLLFCYLLFPYLHQIINSLKQKNKIFLLLILTFICIYSPFIVRKFELMNIYSNPFFRLCEFLIGSILSSLSISSSKNSLFNKILFNYKMLIIGILLLIFGVSILVANNIAVDDYMFYNFINIPLFAFLILCFSKLDFKILKNSVIITYLSSLSYCFFLSQLFSNTISKKIIVDYSIINNTKILLLAWSSCFVISILFHEILEKNAFRILKNKKKAN